MTFERRLEGVRGRLGHALWGIAVLLALVAPGVATAAETFRDCRDCPEMISVRAGSFQMGAQAEESAWYLAQGAKPEWAAWEQPRHQVRFAKPFAIGRTEVTRGQFAAFVAATGYQASPTCWSHADGRWSEMPGRTWRSPGFDQGDDHPVVCVSWIDVRAYVRWLSAKTGHAYRLPSEAEWEYVARAGTATMRYWGDDVGNRLACGHANVADLSATQALNWSTDAMYVFQCRDGAIRTSPGASFGANAFGAYGMLGNVWEWTDDCWNDSYVGAPRDGRAWLSGDCGRRPVRGGSWNGRPRDVRAANRNWDRVGYRNDNLGFRVVRSD